MHAYFHWFYSLPMVRWDENATKATNVASKDRSMVPSRQCMFIFIDFIPYLQLDGMKMQQKPQTLQAKIDQWLFHIVASLSFLHQQL